MHRHGRTRACIYSTLSWLQVSFNVVSYFLLFTIKLDFLKLVTYLSFFTIIVIYYGLPLNMIRDVYLTARSFITRFRALSRYRTATRDMDRRYPNATDEELTAMSDRTCIICRDELATSGANGPAPNANEPQIQAPNTTPKKLPCGHIFHFNCLRSWLERQQSCPTWYVLFFSYCGGVSADTSPMQSTQCIGNQCS